jgi:hypothetical protein
VLGQKSQALSPEWCCPGGTPRLRNLPARLAAARRAARHFEAPRFVRQAESAPPPFLMDVELVVEAKRRCLIAWKEQAVPEAGCCPELALCLALESKLVVEDELQPGLG